MVAELRISLPSCFLDSYVIPICSLQIPLFLTLPGKLRTQNSQVGVEKVVGPHVLCMPLPSGLESLLRLGECDIPC